MTDGRRFLAGMAFGAFAAFVIGGLYLGWNFAHAGGTAGEWASRLLFGLLLYWPFFLL
jgi:hypothetical protein